MPKQKRKMTLARAIPIVLAALVVLVIVAFLTMRQNPGYVSFGENMVGSVVAPVQAAFARAGNFARTWMNDYRDRRKLETEHAEYKRKLALLELELDRLGEVILENNRLRDALDAKEYYESLDLDPLYALVIAKSEGPFFSTFWINRGADDGVKPGSTVIAARGLVGTVLEVGDKFAKVLSIIDGSSAVAGVIERTRDNGTMRGQLASGHYTSMLRMDILETSASNIVPGYRVSTSGLDRKYPPGLIVGEVAEVHHESSGSGQYLLIAPYADFERLSEVLVLRSEVAAVEEAPLPELPSPTPRPYPTAAATPITEPGQTSVPTIQPGAMDPGDMPVEDIEDQLTDMMASTPGPDVTPDEADASGNDATGNLLPEDAWAG